MVTNEPVLLLEAEAVLVLLLDAWEQTKPPRTFYIISAGNRIMTMTHPGLQDGELDVDWQYVSNLRDCRLIDFDMFNSDGRRPGPHGSLSITSRGRDYVREKGLHAYQNVQAVAETFQAPAIPGKPTLFIVHGRDDVTKLTVKNYLQNTLKLPEPIILHEQPDRGRTLIEKFEENAATVDGAVILLTPDDDYVKEGSNEELRRARQNVIPELGYFLGRFGRRSGKVLLLYKKPLELPSDINGIVYIDISNGVEAAGEKIRRELGL